MQTSRITNKIILLLMICLNSYGLTLEELLNLEKQLGNEPMAPSSFIKECYDLVSREQNPRHVKFLSTLLETAQNKDSEEVLKLLKGYEPVLKSG